MNKKLFAGMLATTMSLAFALPVSVKGDTTELIAEVPSSYTLTIPKKTKISYGSPSSVMNGILKVSGNVNTNKSVEVTAASNSLKRNGGSETLAYTLKHGAATFTKATWSESELRAGLAGAGKELTLSVAIDDTVWKNAKAGTYDGGIVFTAALK